MKKIKWLFYGLILILGLLSFTKVYNSGYQVGDEATDFKLKNVDGKMVSLSDFKSAKGFIVVFTCNHCPYAKKYEDRIIALDKMYKDKGYPVIAINPNDPNVQPQDGFAEMQTRAKEKGFTFPYLVDEGQKIYPVYGATKTPHVYILKKENGKNIVKYIGTIDNNYENPNDVSDHYVQDAVNQLLKNEPVKTEKTVAIGCTIKVKK
ncbi:thioredoxin family protein [Epilithonimonas arachidiradicis]|uniref:Peroxiredoxin n=1 Tax=Epilithonimonas arachidiradicis TaxID=1617282 RepID=A0A420DDF6_9FLAO|nr:thioredoxin family protein [Epilithonimonas arachidiradicis]RKE89812.1 peroxiredoxin [Epilithonimonas arachidiradicis]GGG45503.1 thioredoxin family protein [Epilithonimonas arachidiradicis]